MQPAQETTLNLPADLIASLHIAFDVLGFENDESFIPDAIQYILDGKHEATLGERIAKQPRFSYLLQTYGSGQRAEGINKEIRIQWFQRDDVPPAFFRRIAYILQLPNFNPNSGRSQRFPTAYSLASEWRHCCGHSQSIDLSNLRRWLNADQMVDDSQLIGLLFESCSKTDESVLKYHMSSVVGWNSLLNEQAASLDQFFCTRPAAEQVHLLGYLELQSYDPINHFNTLAKSLAKSSSRELRQTIIRLFRQDVPKTVSMLQQLLSEKAASARTNVIESLFDLDPVAANEIAIKHLANEKSSSVQEFIDKILVLHASNIAQTQQDSDLVPSPATASDLSIELGEVCISAHAWIDFEQRLQEYYVKEQQAFVSNRRLYADTAIPLTDEQILESQWKGESYAARLPEIRQTMEKGIPFKRKEGTNEYWHLVHRLFDFFVTEPVVSGIRLVHILRLHYLGSHENYGAEDKLAIVIEKYLVNEREFQSDFSLLHLAHLEGSMPGRSVPDVLKDYLCHLGRDETVFGWDAGQVAPFYATNPHCIQQLFQRSISGSAHDLDLDAIRGAASVLAQFPSFSTDLANLLWQYALCEKKQGRKEIQKILSSQFDFLPRIKNALKSKQSSTREAAYLWLGVRRASELIIELEDAFLKERSEPLKVHSLNALEAAGVDLSKLLNRSELLAEAEAGLKKIRAELKWLPWEVLPSLHWIDTKELIPESIVRWWILQAVALKSPVASPLLRRWLDQCDSGDVRAFANWLYSNWIERSTAIGAESVLPEKGLLAFPGCVCDNNILAKAHAYLKEHYGFKIGECRALLDMASGSDQPEALHFLKKISHGFRTKSIQSHAQKLIEQAAELRGWTPNEFADRVIPDGGFVQTTTNAQSNQPLPSFAIGHPTLELDFGGRLIYAILNDELECVVMTSEGKTLKKLPDAANTDDSEKVAFAKKQFTAGKKAVKDVVAVETHRLFEAMCVERCWQSKDWKEFLQKHAILGKMVQRIVWTAWSSEENKAPLGSFRPIADGTLVTNCDSTFDLRDDCLVQIAHGFSLGVDEAKSWRVHMDDYEVIPLLRQFNPPRQFAPSQHDDESIGDFLGYRIDYFKFKRLAEKLGYFRGQAEDGGRFYTFKKSIASASIEVEIHFSGNHLPEQSGLIALDRICFVKKRTTSGYAISNAKNEKLRKIPRLLLSESHFDLQQLAEAGIGFSDDWKTGLVL